MRELPEGWELKALSEVADVILGQSPPGTSYNTEGKGVPFFQGKAEFGDLYPEVRKWTTEPKKLARAGDVLISVRAPVGPTNMAQVDCSVGRGLAALRVRNDIPSKYLLYAVRATSDALASKATGTTFSAISGDQLKAHSVAVAPIYEQQRIVEVIEEQFSRLDAGVESLQRAKRNLTRLRSAAALSAFDLEWPSKPLGEIAEVSGGIQKQPKRRPSSNPYPYMRVANVLRGELDLTDIAYMELFEGELVRYRLEPGDLLIVEGNGSPSQIGRSARWDGAIEDCVHQNHIIRARPSEDMDPRFLDLYWNSPTAIRRITRVAASTSGLYTLSTSKVKAVPVPVLPLEVQRDVVDELARQFSIIDAMGNTIDAGLRRAGTLRQSILSQAFSGRLTGAA